MFSLYARAVFSKPRTEKSGVRDERRRVTRFLKCDVLNCTLRTTLALLPSQRRYFPNTPPVLESHALLLVKALMKLGHGRRARRKGRLASSASTVRGSASAFATEVASPDELGGGALRRRAPRLK